MYSRLGTAPIAQQCQKSVIIAVQLVVILNSISSVDPHVVFRGRIRATFSVYDQYPRTSITETTEASREVQSRKT